MVQQSGTLKFHTQRERLQLPTDVYDRGDQRWATMICCFLTLPQDSHPRRISNSHDAAGVLLLVFMPKKDSFIPGHSSLNLKNLTLWQLLATLPSHVSTRSKFQWTKDFINRKLGSSLQLLQTLCGQCVCQLHVKAYWLSVDSMLSPLFFCYSSASSVSVFT